MIYVAIVDFRST